MAVVPDALAPDMRGALGPAARSSRVVSVAAVLLVAAMALPASIASGQQDDDGFRAACDLIEASEVGRLVGSEVSASGLGAQGCIWASPEGGSGPSIFVTLDESGGLEINRLVLPDAEDLSVAGREAVGSVITEPTAAANLIVALEGGGTMHIQVVPAEGQPEDPLAAATAIGEAIFMGGPVLARPAAEESGPALGYEGDICELVTLAEVREATGKRKFATAESAETSCSYTSDDFSLLLSVAFVDGDLFELRSGDSDDLTVGGLPAVWSTDFFDVLAVDVGGGRMLQVSPLVFEGRPRQLREVAQAVAEIAVGRLGPVELAPPDSETIDPDGAEPSGPGCELLPVEEVAGITGRDFASASSEGIEGIGCAYSTADPANDPTFLILTRLEMEDPAAVVASMAEDVPGGLPEVETLEIASHPGMRAVVEGLAVVAVDLDGIPGEDGRVLGIVWILPPADADTGGLLVELAEAAIANL